MDMLGFLSRSRKVAELSEERRSALEAVPTAEEGPLKVVGAESVAYLKPMERDGLVKLKISPGGQSATAFRTDAGTKALGPLAIAKRR